MRLIMVVFLLAMLVGAQPSPTRNLDPTSVTLKADQATVAELATAFSKAPAGVAVIAAPMTTEKAAVNFDRTPFWEALELAADRTRTRLVVRDSGRTVALEPRAAEREVSAVAGAFRIVPRTITGRLLLDSGTRLHELRLDVHWEPRMPVYRMDSNPKITRAEDDRGKALTVDSGVSRHYPTGSLTDLQLRLTGLNRESKTIATLSGEFRATAAEKLLSVAFRNPTQQLPITQDVSGVKVVLESFEQIAGMWDSQFEVTYPEAHPYFESFEEQKWLRDTRVRLLGPNGKIYEADNDDVIASGRKFTATYRFKLPATADPTGKDWALVCETPSPLFELTVPFVLKDIPLP